jgi:ABC-type transporter Mla maintaining outer membrane lipid asymmetry ATPase subunit MlaF
MTALAVKPERRAEIPSGLSGGLRDRPSDARLIMRAWWL